LDPFASISLIFEGEVPHFFAKRTPGSLSVVVSLGAKPQVLVVLPSDSTIPSRGDCRNPHIYITGYHRYEAQKIPKVNSGFVPEYGTPKKSSNILVYHG